MEIKQMRKIDRGNLKAFFTLSTDTLEINDMKLMEGRDGNLYADTPSKEFTEAGQKKYAKIVWIKKQELRDRITELAREAYYELAR